MSEGKQRKRTAGLWVLIALGALQTGCLANLSKHYTSEKSSSLGPPIQSTAEINRETRQTVRFNTTGVEDSTVRAQATLATSCKITSSYQVDEQSVEDRSLNQQGKSIQYVNAGVAVTLAVAGTYLMAAPCETESGAPCSAQEESNLKTAGGITLGTSLIPVGFMIANAARTGEKKETHRVPQQKSTEWNECSTQPYEGAVLVRMNDGQSLVVNSSTDGSFSVDVPDGVAKVFVSAQGVAADLDIQPLLARREEEARRRLEEEAQRRAAAAAALAQAEREARAKEVANWPTVSVVPLLQGGADMMELIKRKNAAKGSWSLEDVMVGLTQGFQMMMAMQSMGASCLSAAGVKDFRLTLGGATGDKYQDEANCKSLMDSFYGDSIEFVSVNEIKVEPETLASLKKMRTFVEANAGKWAQEDYQDCYRSCLREKAFATQAHCDAVCRP